MGRRRLHRHRKNGRYAEHHDRDRESLPHGAGIILGGVLVLWSPGSRPAAFEGGLRHAEQILVVVGAGPDGGMLSRVRAQRGAAKHKAKPKTVALLPNVGCQKLLSLADFPGAASEGPLAHGAFSAEEEGRTNPDAFYTTCEFYPPESTEQNPTPGGIGGIDTLTVEHGFRYQHLKGHDLIYPPPSGSTFMHSIGTRAYYRINESNPEEHILEGWLQVRNDLFTVTRNSTAGVSIYGMLAQVAGELCRCK
jgi:hypothetical protein